MPAALTDFMDAVRHNCDLSDAQHAGDYSLCVYLMHMREYYRWEQKLPLDAKLSSAEVGDWVASREQHWDNLEGQTYRSLPLPTGGADPFDVERINDWLTPIGYNYSAGIGRFGKPVFALGELAVQESGEGYRLFCTEREWVRELIAPPAMTRGRSIWVRREALRRVLWEMIEEWRWKKPANAMALTLSCYGFDTDPTSAVERMTEEFAELAILHELGEKVCGEYLGEDWEKMLMATADRAEESLIRAVRDHLADCWMVLPALLNEQETGALHFYFATLTGLRRQLFPTLFNAYRRWVADHDPEPLRGAVREGAAHWLRRALVLLEDHRANLASAPRTVRVCSVESLAL